MSEGKPLEEYFTSNIQAVDIKTKRKSNLTDEAVEEDTEYGTVAWLVYWKYATAGAGAVIFTILYFVFAFPAQVISS